MLRTTHFESSLSGSCIASLPSLKTVWPLFRWIIVRPCSKSLNFSSQSDCILRVLSSAASISASSASGLNSSVKPCIFSNPAAKRLMSARQTSCCKCAPCSLRVVRVGSGSSTMSAVTSKLLIALEGSSNLKSRNSCSSTVINPRAPVPSVLAFSAIARIACAVMLKVIP